jgi:uncharacterized protein (DUF2267 family)
MMDELIDAVARAAGLSREQATRAVAAVLRFCTARLPSSLVGELHARLQTRRSDGSTGCVAASAPESVP